MPALRAHLARQASAARETLLQQRARLGSDAPAVEVSPAPTRSPPQPGMYVSRLAAGGLLLALLALALDGKPAPPPPPPPHKGPPGGTTALKRELAELLEASSGPAAGGGRSSSKAGAGSSSASTPQQQPPQTKSKGASTASRLMRDLRTDTKQSRAAWGRLVHPEHHAGGGGGGGGGSRRLKGLAKKGLAKGCFGLKLDRIGSMSGLGC